MATEHRAPGRPRSEQSRQAVLTAARDLVVRDGIDRMSIDGIATRAGVSKATIYRWWSGKLAVVTDAVIGEARRTIEFRNSGDVRADLDHELRAVITFFTTTQAGAALLRLLAAGRTDPDLGAVLQERAIGPLCDEATEALRRGMRTGQLRDDVDTDMVIDVIWGSVYHRLLVTYAPLTPDYATELLDMVWVGLGL